MKKKRFKIANELGLHARPASLFVQTGVRHNCSIKVKKKISGEELVVNGKSVMGIMMLAAAQGDTITITTEGPDEEKAMADFEELFGRNFNE